MQEALYWRTTHIRHPPYKMSGFGHPCLTFSITQRSTLPPANSYKDGQVQPTSIHTRKYSLFLCSKCRASNYAPFFFLRFEIGCGQADDLSSDQIAVLCSRVVVGVLILSDHHFMSIFAPVPSRVWSVGGVSYSQTKSESTRCDQQYLLDNNKNYLRYTLNRIRQRPWTVYIRIKWDDEPFGYAESPDNWILF